MDPLHQYSAYTFIPYITASTSTNTSSVDLPSLKIKHTSTYTYCGPLLSPSTPPASLHPWLTQTTTSPSAFLSRLLPLLTFLRAFLEKAHVHHYWLTLRATTPTKEHDVPRWHVDDNFFAPASGPQIVQDTGRHGRKDGKKKGQDGSGGWKLCTTLLGPSTLFLRTSSNTPALRTLRVTKERESARREHICTYIRCAGCFDTGNAVRKALALAFADEEVVQSGYGEVAFFHIGDEGAVHSEPKCGVDRVFVNVVPGTERGLRTLMGRYGMGFPRAWSLGVPGGLLLGDGLVDGMGEAEGSQDCESGSKK